MFWFIFEVSLFWVIYIQVDLKFIMLMECPYIFLELFEIVILLLAAFKYYNQPFFANNLFKYTHFRILSSNLDHFYLTLYYIIKFLIVYTLFDHVYNQWSKKYNKFIKWSNY
jgi:hypothetical protein